MGRLVLALLVCTFYVAFLPSHWLSSLALLLSLIAVYAGTDIDRRKHQANRQRKRAIRRENRRAWYD